MFYRKCNGCGCSLDPGEGSLCDECISEREQEQRRRKEMNRMTRSSTYKQIELEEFIYE